MDGQQATPLLYCGQHFSLGGSVQECINIWNDWSCGDRWMATCLRRLWLLWSVGGSCGKGQENNEVADVGGEEEEEGKKVLNKSVGEDNL